ncbi:MAG: hypothetical protein R2875_10480 [Desulfobacterales bacterium]
MPEESKKHADAVVIGDGGNGMATGLSGLPKRSVKAFYKSENSYLSHLPIPKRHLPIPQSGAAKFSDDTTGRGCPHHCTFCLLQKVYGGTYRKRPVVDILCSCD